MPGEHTPGRAAVAAGVTVLLVLSLVAVGATATAATDVGPSGQSADATTAASDGDDGVQGAQTMPTPGDAHFDVAIEGVEVDVPDQVVVQDGDAGDSPAEFAVRVHYSVENTGSASATQNVTLEAEADDLLPVIAPLASHEVTLAPGESYHGTFEVTEDSVELTSQDTSICQLCSPIAVTFTVSSADDSDSERVVLEPGDEEPPNFEIDRLDTNEPVAGEDLEVTVGVRNTGDVGGTQTVSVDAGPLGETAVDLALDGGESAEETVAFSTGAEDVGTHEVTATTGDDEAATTATVRPESGERAHFAVTIDDIRLDVPDFNSTDPVPLPPVELGFAVDYTVENTGNASDAQDVVLEVEGAELESHEVALEPGQRHSDTFEHHVGVFGEDEAGVIAGANSTDALYDVIAETALLPEPPYIPELTVAVESEDDRAEETIVVEPGEQPRFVIDDVETNDPVAGEDLEVALDVTNAGDVVDTQQVAVDVSGVGSTAALQLLGPGESATVTFTLPTEADDAGNHTLTARTGDDVAEATATVHPPETDRSHFAVDITDVRVAVPDGPRPMAWPGDSFGYAVEAEYTVENTGEAADTQDVVFTVEGGEAGSDELTLEPGADHAGTFTATVPVFEPLPEPAVYPVPPYEPEITVAVSSEDDRDTETVSPSPGEDPAFTVDSVEAGDPVEGEDLVVAVQVTNTRDVVDTQALSVDAGDLGSKSTIQLLGPGETVVQQFRFATEIGDAGDYEVTARTGSDAASTEATVRTANESEALFDVTIEETAINVTTPVEPLPSLTSGLDLQVAVEATYTVENVGGAVDEQPITFTVDGDEQDRESVHLEPGDAHEGTFSHELNISEMTGADQVCPVPHAEDCLPHVIVEVASEDDSDAERVVLGPGGVLPAFAERPPMDLDGDGLHQDVRGDGEVGVFDVQTLFENMDDPAVQENAELFDFQGESPDAVTIFDVQALFEQTA